MNAVEKTIILRLNISKAPHIFHEISQINKRKSFEILLQQNQ